MELFIVSDRNILHSRAVNLICLSLRIPSKVFHLPAIPNGVEELFIKCDRNKLWDITILRILCVNAPYF